MREKAVNFLLILVLLVPLYGSAQDFWESTSCPAISSIHSIVTVPVGDIFAGTDSEGIFHSADNGISWEKNNTGLTNLSVYCLAVNSAGDIFVFSSFYDNLPNSVLEAMASELPVVAPSVGGIPMIVEEKVNGYLYSVGNTQEFVEKVNLLLKDKNLREKMGKENRKKIIENFNWEKSAEKLKELYEQLF